MSTVEIPLFPLRTVLFPGGYLPLRIFEQRYLTMVRDCARNDTGFGVCLIREGEEAVSPVKTAQVGTHAQIIDWYTLEDGLLGVSATGTVRFITENAWQEDDGLFRAQVRVLPEPPECAVPEAFLGTKRRARTFHGKSGPSISGLHARPPPGRLWLGYRLSELLPLAGIEKQHLLELSDPIERLQNLVEILPRFQSA